MKKTLLSMPLQAISLILVLVMFSCQDDDFSVPAASTQADFTYEVEAITDQDTGEMQFEVQFINKSVLATSYNWDFGNGQTSTQENPSVLYEGSGQYVVTLTVGSANDLYYNNLTKSVSLTLGKDVIFEEDFMGGVPDGDDDWLPQGWLAIDNDGDGINWYFAIRTGQGQMRSESYDSSTGEALTPDNWLILPEQDFTAISQGASITFRYTVGVTASTPIYREEHYGIFISAEGNSPDDFVMLFEETMSQETPNWDPQERTLDISEYAGMNVYIAIRHFNVSDKDRIFINEVEIYKID